MRCASLLVAVLAVGCMELPRRAAERALYIDARKVVEVNERLGWEIDRLEVDDALGAVLPSVCESTEDNRLGVLRWVNARIEAEGGSAQRVYLENGRDLGEATTLLRLERVRAVLRASGEAAVDDCPFWMEPDPEFHGIHGVGRRATLILESRGGAGIVFRGEDAALGGTGGGRVLVSWAFGDRLTLATGGELGGVAAFPENDMGNRTLEGNFAGAIPLLLRIYNGLSIFDVETAASFRYKDGNVRTPGVRTLASFRYKDGNVRTPGVRGSLGFGVSALRGAGFMPHAIFWIGYEWQPPRDGTPAEHGLRVGTKIGLNWDPF